MIFSANKEKGLQMKVQGFDHDLVIKNTGFFAASKDKFPALLAHIHQAHIHFTKVKFFHV